MFANVAVDWVALLQTFGLAVVILFALGIGIWKVAVWIGKELIIPFRDKAIDQFASFLARLDRNVDAMTNNLEKQTYCLERLETTTARIQVITEATYGMISNGDEPRKV